MLMPNSGRFVRLCVVRLCVRLTILNLFKVYMNLSLRFFHFKFFKVLKQIMYLWIKWIMERCYPHLRWYFCQIRRESRSFLLQYRWLLGDEKGVEVMYNIKSPRLSDGSACENLSSLRAKVPWSWSFQLHRYTHTKTHWRSVKTRSASKGV